jgi:ankyrin repeat protein
LSRVAELLDAGASVNGQELNHSCFPFYDTPLHRAALEGHEEVVRLLVSRGALVNKPNGRGCTPLHLTTIRHHEKIALLLIRYGADINQQDEDGSTPLHHAIKYGYKPFVQFLIDHGADINKPDRDGKTPLQTAVSNPISYNQTIIRLLISRGALANKPTNPTRKRFIDVFAVTAACAALLYVGSSSIALLVGRL